MAFKFKDGSHIKGDPQKIGEELERIRCSSGNLTATAVWTAARRPSSVLHPHFTWDIQKAARERWEDQARYLIRSITVRFSDDESESPSVRAFVSLGEPEEGFVPMAVVLSQNDLRARLLQKATEELASFRQKYADLSELWRLFTLIDEVTETLAVEEVQQ
jgi:hypothetical protein